MKKNVFLPENCHNESGSIAESYGVLFIPRKLAGDLFGLGGAISKSKILLWEKLAQLAQQK